ncbi:hypothetical protein QEN19_004223 [Hanseniaspora menglaensis]
MNGLESNESHDEGTGKPLYYNDHSSHSEDDVIDLMTSSVEEEEEDEEDEEDDNDNDNDEDVENEKLAQETGFSPMNFFKNSSELPVNLTTDSLIAKGEKVLASDYAELDENIINDNKDGESDVEKLFDDSHLSEGRSESKFLINPEEINIMEEEEDKGENKLIRLALANANNQVENSDEDQNQYIPHFDNILRHVSEIKSESKEEELKQKNQYLLNIAKNLSFQASAFKRKYREVVIDKDELIGNHDKEIDSREEELDNLQQDIDEMELHNRKNIKTLKDLKLAHEALKASKKQEVSDILEKLEQTDLTLKRTVDKLDFTTKNKMEIEKLYEESKIDSESLLKKISVAEYSRDTEISFLKSEIVMKDSHINNLQNQVSSFTKAGFNNSVSVEDYDSLVTSFKQITDENQYLQQKLNERENDLKELLDFSSVSSDSNIEFLKKELISEKIQKDQLQKQLEEIVSDLEVSIPAMKEYKEKCIGLESQLLESNDLLEGVEEERNQLFQSNLLNDNKIDELKEKLEESNLQNTDLANQLQAILLQLSLRTDVNLLNILSESELRLIKKLTNKTNSAEQTKNIQAAISDNLVVFKDIKSLQEQNQKLLLATRKLGEELETLQSVKDDMSKTISLENSVQNLEIEKEKYESKIKLLKQEHKNLDTVKLLSENSSQKRKNELEVQNYKTQIINLENQLAESHNRILKQSEENSNEIVSFLKKITELNFQISTLKSDSSILKFKVEQLEKEKISTDCLLTKEQESKNRLNELLVANGKRLSELELELKEACEAKLLEKSKNDEMRLKFETLDQAHASLKAEHNTLTRQADSYKADLERVQCLKKEIDYLLRHSDAEYWSNLATLEKKLRENKTEIPSEDDTNFGNVSNILESFERHMKYHSNQAQEFRKLLSEKDEIIEKLNVNTRIQEMVEELANKKKEYDDLSAILSSKNDETSDLIKTLEINKKEIQDGTAACGKLKEELSSLHESITGKNLQISQLNAMTSKLTDENNALDIKLKNLDVGFKQKVKNLEVDYDELEHACKEFEERYNSSKDENDKLKQKLALLDKQNLDFTQNIENISAELENKNSELSGLKESLISKQTELETLKLNIEQKEESSELSEFKSRVEDLNRKNEELSAKLNQLEESSKTSQETNFTEHKEIVNNQEFDQLKNDLVVSESQKEKLSVEITALENNKREFESKISSLEVEIESLKSENNESKVQEIDALQDKIQALEKENREQRASVLKVKLLEQKLKKFENQPSSANKTPSVSASVQGSVETNLQTGNEVIKIEDKADVSELETIASEHKADMSETESNAQILAETKEFDQKKSMNDVSKEFKPDVTLKDTKSSEVSRPAFTFSFGKNENATIPSQQKPAFLSDNSTTRSVFGQSSFGNSSGSSFSFGSKRSFTSENKHEEESSDSSAKKPKFNFGLENNNQMSAFGNSVFGNFGTSNNDADDKDNTPALDEDKTQD